MILLQSTRLSHSEIRGSKVICTYPQLIAAYRREGYVTGNVFGHDIEGSIPVKIAKNDAENILKKKISTLLHTTESVDALPTSMEPPSTV